MPPHRALELGDTLQALSKHISTLPRLLALRLVSRAFNAAVMHPAIWHLRLLRDAIQPARLASRIATKGLFNFRLGGASMTYLGEYAAVADVDEAVSGADTTDWFAAYQAWWLNTIHHRTLASMLQPWCFTRDSARWDAVTALEASWGERLPCGLKQWLTRTRVNETTFALYPTCNDLVALDKLTVMRACRPGLFAEGFGDRALNLIRENQDCCQWYVVWFSADADCQRDEPWPMDPPVFITDWPIEAISYSAEEEAMTEPNEYWKRRPEFRLSNRGLNQFLHDYFAEGIKWYADESWTRNSAVNEAYWESVRGRKSGEASDGHTGSSASPAISDNTQDSM